MNVHQLPHTTNGNPSASSNLLSMHQQHPQPSLPVSHTYPGVGSSGTTSISTGSHPISCCRVCGAPTELRRCSSCKSAFYCSQTHQQSDWPNHRAECRQLSRLLAVRQMQQQQQQQQQQQLHEQYDQHEMLLLPQNECSIGSSASSDSAGEPSASNAFGWPSETTATAIEHVGDAIQLGDHTEVPTTAAQHQQLGMSTPTAEQTPFELAAAQMQLQQQEKQQQQQQLLQQQQKHEQEKKERDLRNFSAENTMSVSEMSLMASTIGASNMRDDDLCKIIINDMNTYGLAVIDDFLGRASGMEILREVDNMYGAGVFQNGQLVSNTASKQSQQTIRGDKITWVKGTEPTCTNIGFLINQIDNLVITANRMRENGTLGQYKIRERTKAMVACYPGSGSHYVMHVDNPNHDGRVITAIYYLNLNWDSAQYGGRLTIHPKPGNSLATIDPAFDRILFFWSDRRNPHEVQPAHRTRYAITVWYFDADERETALNRNRDQQQHKQLEQPQQPSQEQPSSSAASGM